MLPRAGIVFLAAFLMTALWAPMLYFGSPLFGLVSHGNSSPATHSGGHLLFLGVGLAVSAGSNANSDNPSRRKE